MGISLLYYFKYPFVEIMFFGRPLGGFGKTDTFGQGVGGGQKIEKNADVLFECPHITAECILKVELLSYLHTHNGKLVSLFRFQKKK